MAGIEPAIMSSKHTLLDINIIKIILNSNDGIVRCQALTAQSISAQAAVAQTAVPQGIPVAGRDNGQQARQLSKKLHD